MKKASLILLVSCSTLLYSQIRYSGKIEPNLNINIGRTLTVDPTPYWQGYDLDHKQNGSGINFINGVMFREKFFAGLGVGYQNFYHADASPKNIHGAAFFFNGEYVNLEKPRSILFYTNLGLSTIWKNSGTHATSAVEIGTGYNSQFMKDHIYIKGGIGLMHHHAFLKFGAGYRF